MTILSTNQLIMEGTITLISSDTRKKSGICVEIEENGPTIIPDLGYSIVNIVTADFDRVSIDTSQMGSNVSEIYVEQFISCVGKVPPSVKVFACEDIDQTILPESLECLCSGRIRNDYVFPPGLKVLVCYNRPRYIPRNLTHVAFVQADIGRTILGIHPIPDTVTHMVGSAIHPHVFPPKLEFLSLESRSLVLRGDMGKLCPNLTRMSVVENYPGISYHKLSSKLRKGTLFTISDGIPVVEEFADGGLILSNLPANLRELYLSPRLRIMGKFSRFPLLEKLHCNFGCYELPKNLKRLAMNLSTRSGASFREMNDKVFVEQFVNRLEGIDKLAIVGLTKTLYEKFCSEKLVDTLYLLCHPPFDTAKIQSDVVTCGYYLAGGIISNYSHSNVVDFHCSGTITVYRADRKLVKNDEGVKMVEFPTCDKSYIHAGDDEILDVFDNTAEVCCIRVPGEFQQKSAKSARK